MQENRSTIAPKCNFRVEDLVAQNRITMLEIYKLESELEELNVPQLTHELMALFLLSCDHDVPFAMLTIREYYKARQGAPEFFVGRCLTRQDLSYQINIIRYAVFPQLTPDGCAIMYHSLFDYNAWHYDIEHSMKLLFMTLDSIVYDYPPKGLVIVFDMKGMGLMHLTRARFTAIRKFAHYLQEGLPIKLKEIHVMNTQYLINKVMALMKPVLKENLYKLMRFHPPMDDYSKFHADYLPKNCLPSDLDGDLPSINDLHAINAKKMAEMLPYFEAEEKHRYEYYEKSVDK